MSTPTNQAIADSAAINQAADLGRARLWHDAEQILAPLVQRSDAPASALDLQAQICAQQGRLSDAEAFWSRALTRDPSNASAQQGLAKVRRGITRSPLVDAIARTVPVLIGVGVLAGVLYWQQQQQESAARDLRHEVEKALASQSSALSQLRGEFRAIGADNIAVQQASMAAHLTAWQIDLKKVIEQEHEATVAKLTDSNATLQTLSDVQKAAANRLNQLNDLSSSLANLTKLLNATQTQLSETQTAVGSLAGQSKASDAAADKRYADLQSQISKAITQANTDIKDGLVKALEEEQKAASSRLDQIAELSSSQSKVLNATQSQVGDTRTAVGSLTDQVKASDANAEKRNGALQAQIEQTVAKANAQTKEGLLKAIEQQKTAATGRLDQLNDLASSLASLAKLQNSTQAQVSETQTALGSLLKQVKTSQAATDKRISDVQSQIAQAISDSTKSKAIEQQKAGESPTAPQP